jgi:hypothetical protein
LHEQKRRKNVQIAERDPVISKDPHVPSSQQERKLERTEETHYMQNDADHRAPMTRLGRFGGSHRTLPNGGLDGPLA